MTILNLMKIPEISLNGQKTLWVKEKLLITSNFSISHSVFKRLVSQGRQKVSLCGNRLIICLEHGGTQILQSHHHCHSISAGIAQLVERLT